LLAAVVPLSAAIEGPVRVESGMLAGIIDATSDVSVFKGIPFAAPPVGALRWRAPEPPAKWQSVRQATKFSAACMQNPYAEGSPYRTAAEPMSEDCLYLNVWTGAKSANERRPVMVWIYGGALTRGSASLPTYDGAELAKKGVVLVSFNYRLGVFGFFAHPELTAESAHHSSGSHSSGDHSSGNYGFLDQIAALQWVQRNIAQFGGDPNRVTIFGESAGSWSVNLLVASPLAKGLFQGAIGESGANFAPMAKLADIEKAGAGIAKSLGADSLAALRTKSAEEILRANGESTANVDGWVLPVEVRAIFAAGQQNDVPVLIGSNADEGTAFSSSVRTMAALQAVSRRYGDQAGAFLKLYPADSDEQAQAAQAAAIRDQYFGWEMRTWARLQSKTGKSKTYLYYFSRVPPGPGSELLGAYHSAEIAYAFHNLGISKRPWEEADRKLADAMSSYWVNFATTGDPNGKGLPAWPVYDSQSERAMGLGNRIEPLDIPHKAALDFFDEWFARR
jgi:para-nitrobenzyl esterase